MFDLTMELVQKLLKDGFGLGFMITVLLLLRKRLRNQQLHDRDVYWTELLEAMARKAGIQWDANLIALQNSAAKRKGFFESLTHIFARSAPKTKAYPFTINLNLSKGMKAMKEYLKKLGKTKFQAYLLVTFINIATFILYVNGNLQVDATIDQWMPLINLGTQMIATMIYQHIEGSIDREAQKQQVYVMPGSADAKAAEAVVSTDIESMTRSEIMMQVRAVNAELNDYIGYIEKHPNDIGKEAAIRYLKIHDLLKKQDPLTHPEDSEAN
jgi:hypothetical protein